MERNPEGYVYFIRAGIVGLIKIGFSEIYPDSRLAAHQVSSPVELERFAYVYSSLTHEQRLHLRFAHLRERGEWFRPGDDLLEFIRLNTTPWRRRTRGFVDPTPVYRERARTRRELREHRANVELTRLNVYRHELAHHRDRLEDESLRAEYDAEIERAWQLAERTRLCIEEGDAPFVSFTRDAIPWVLSWASHPADFTDSGWKRGWHLTRQT
jgi:hypothetical protein